MLLVGNPNSGKTTLFNLLTGLSQKTANYPGVTVESKSGFFRVYDTGKKGWHRIELVDLPGIYSLSPISEDEVQAVDPIRYYEGSGEKEDVLVLFVADTLNPSRSLHLFLALRDRGFKTALLLNMAYMAGEKGIVPDLDAIRADLPGVPVAVSDRSRGKTAHRIKELIRSFGDIRSAAGTDKPYTDYVTLAAEKQRKWFRITPQAKTDRQTRADRVLMHPVSGPLIFLALMFLIFQSLFSLSAYPMKWIENGMAALSEFSLRVLPHNEISQLWAEGILPGITGILVFIPQIAFLFFFISLMEESGYLSRVTFLADNLMRRFGMNGKSLIPFAGGAACAVPAIMSARTISNPRERLITILVTPFVTCSARLPVFVTLIAVFVPEGRTGIFSTRGLVLAAFYLAGVSAVFLGAWVLHLILKKGKTASFFMMELPDYRLPSARSVGKVVWQKVGDFVWNAGKIIIAISVVLWVLASYGPRENMRMVDEKYEAVDATAGMKQIPGYRSEKLEQSYAGRFGRVIEPVIRPLGFDWKIGIGLLTSFAAREVFVGTMNTIYGLGDHADEKQLSEVLAKQTDPVTGRRRFDTATSLSLMVFFLLAMQCMSTFAVVRRETGSLKMALLQLAFMTITAYFASLATYQLIRLF